MFFIQGSNFVLMSNKGPVDPCYSTSPARQPLLLDPASPSPEPEAAAGSSSSSPPVTWRLLLLQSPSSPPPRLAAFAPLVRRYARLGRASAALRAFHFLRRNPDRYTVDGDGSPAATSLLNMAVGALCKEGHPRPAAKLVERCRREGELAPDERTYNMLLDGWSSARRLDKVGKLWAEMRVAGVRPPVVSYGTLIKAVCRMQQPDQALSLLDEMRMEGN